LAFVAISLGKGPCDSIGGVFKTNTKSQPAARYVGIATDTYVLVSEVKVKVKAKVHPRTGHEGTEAE
jgi:hypothetical protein